MTKFELPSFSVGYGGKAYTDNWETCFGKKDLTKCQFVEDCPREVDVDNSPEPHWCNFHLITELNKNEESAVDTVEEEGTSGSEEGDS